MSKYTTEVRYICENAAGLKESKGYADIDKIIEDSIDSIFSFDFPIFDGSYRNVLCTKILRHYYTREIGFETVGLWKLKLQTKLNEIMPYYNKLYESELLKFNPLYDVDLSTTHVGDKSGESNNTTANNKNAEINRDENRSGVSTVNNERTESGNTNKTSDFLEDENREVNSASEASNANVSTNKTDRSSTGNESGTDEKTDVKAHEYSDTEGSTNWDLYSDTPQGALTDVDEEEYLTNARKITDSKTKSGKDSDTNVGQDKYEKDSSNQEDTNSEASSFGNESVKNDYGEKNSKVNVGSEKEEKSGSTIDSGNKSEFGNSNTQENSKSSENAISMDKYNSTESYVVHVIGKQAGTSFSKLLKEFRDTFLNIDLDVINSLSDLFMNLW